MVTVYLAHPGAEGTKLFVKNIQRDILEPKGFTVLNPFDHNKIAIKYCETWDYHPEKRTESLARKIVTLDKECIDKADLVLAFVTQPSIGTSMEIFYANQTGKPVYIITNLQSPWLMSHGKVLNSIEEFLEEVNKNDI